MKFINKAKKGMVLIMTTVILFIATSTVAVLSSFVLVTRNQKIENEYVARSQIILKNTSFDIYQNVLLPKIVARGSAFSLTNPIILYAAEFDSVGINYADEVKVICSFNKYESNMYYYQYEISTEDITGYTREEIRDMKLITTVNFNKNDDLSKASSFSIGEMRFSQ